jgi:SEC-C motif
VLKSDQLKPFLVHEDRFIRRAASDYFADGWSRDPDLIPLILDACDRYGDKENLRGLSCCDRLLMNGQAFDRVLDHLAKTEDGDAIYHLNRVIVHLPGDLLAARQVDVLGHPKLLREIIPQIRLRCDLAGWTGQKLWDELQEYARQSEDKKDTGGIDHGYVGALVDALARRDVPDDDTICRLLRSLESEEGWLEIFLIDLAGARRIPDAVPALVDKFYIDTDYLLERSKVALARIGDAGAVRLIRTAYPTAPEHFKHYTSGIFGDIKHEESEQAILGLLEVESDPTFRTILCVGLCDLFSERGFDVVRGEIASGYDAFYSSLEEHLLPVAEVLGIGLPEADSWRRQRAEQGEQRAARLAEMAELDRRFKALKARGIDPFDRLGTSERVARTQLPAVTAPVRHAAPRVGRNDPCPCGSGKKSKKCCGRGG